MVCELILTLAQVALLVQTWLLARDPLTRTQRCRSLPIVVGLSVQAGALLALGLLGPAVSTSLNALCWAWIVWRRAP